MTRVRPVLSFLALVGLASVLTAQSPTLSFNGEQHAAAAQGRFLDIRIEGAPNGLVTLAFNVDPGPTDFLGQSVPLGLGAGLVVTLSNVPTDAGGVLTDSSFKPSLNPFLEGMKVYAVALDVSPVYPGGFAFSNGADITFVRRIQAGPPTTGLVGEPTTANALENLDAGALPAGYTISWTIDQQPGGSSAQLEGEDTLVPTLVGDTPGNYWLRCQLDAPGTTGGAFDLCRVELVEVAFGGRDQGGFDASDPVSVGVVASGPVANLAVDGIGASNLGSVAGSLPAGQPFTGARATVTGVSGQSVARGLTIVAGSGGALDAPVPGAMSAHLGAPVFDDLEALVDQALAAVDLSAPLNTFVAGLPAVEVINLPAPFPPGVIAFSASIDPTGATFDPGITSEIQPAAGELLLGITLTNLALTFDLGGVVFGAPYTDTGTLNVPTATLSAGLVTTVQPDGTFSTVVNSSNLDLVGATLTLDGGAIPSTFLSSLVSAAEVALEQAIAPALAALLPPVLDSALNAVPTSFDLGGGNSLDLAVAGFGYQTHGMTVGLDGGLTTAGSAGGPGLFYATPEPAPLAFPALTPTGGMPYALGVALSDDLVNQSLARLAAAGGLEIATSGDLANGLIPAQAGPFAGVFPGLGLELLDPATPVRLVLAPEVAPIVRFDGTDDVVLEVSDLIVAVEAELRTGYWAPIARLGLRGSLGLDLDLDLVAGTIGFLPGTAAITLDARSSLAGLEIASTVANYGPALQFLYPLLAGTIPPIALPALPVGTVSQVVDVAPLAGTTGFLAIYLD